jgi:hypothetical protein
MNIGYNFELRKAYYNTITGITYNGSPLQCFDSFATDDADAPYVVVDSMNSSDNRNKADSVEDCSIVVDITSSASQGGRKTTDEIASLIIAAKSSLRANVGSITTAFALMDVYKITDNTLTLQSGTEKIYRRIITFGHTVAQ